MMKLKMQVTTKADQVLVTTVELSKLDMEVAVKKAVMALGLDMSEVREVRTVSG